MGSSSLTQTLRLLEEGRLGVAEALHRMNGADRPGNGARGNGTPGNGTPGNGAKKLGANSTGIHSNNCQKHEDPMSKAFAELDPLIGLHDVKKLVKEIVAFTEIQRRRVQHDLAAEPTVLHMVFSGNPGTGKTTVARILGRLFKAIEVLPKGHIVEVERADMVGEYIGHTAQKTREQIKKATGGILFIDEAYSLARGGEKDFGKEAIDTLVSAMENHKNELVVILAGYKDEMEHFLQTNPGLRSRFPIHIEFPDYTTEELFKIAELMLSQRQYTLSPAARQKLFHVIQDKVSQYQNGNENNFGNARLVRNLIERAIRRQAVRLVHQTNVSRDDLMTITAFDINGEELK